MLICPIKNLGHLINPTAERLYTDECNSCCAWWDSKANFNPKTKQFEGQCCILTLSRLKISGIISTHPS